MDDQKRRYLITELLNLAGQMARGEGMPSRFREDWKNLPPKMTIKGWGEIKRVSWRANEKAHEWSQRLVCLAKLLEK